MHVSAWFPGPYLKINLRAVSGCLGCFLGQEVVYVTVQFAAALTK